MNNTTINDIVRRSLAMHWLPEHYYLPFLLHAKRGLELMHFNILPSAKSTTLTVESNNVAYLPLDFVSEIYVATEVGDKLSLLSRSDKLNPSDNDGNAFAVVDPEDYLTQVRDEAILGVMEIGDMDLIKGQAIQDRYRVIRDEGIIRIDNRSELTSIHLRYITLPQKVSSQSVIHPLAADALLDYIAWKWAEYNPSNRFEPRTKRKEFFNSYRILRASLKKFNIKDIYDHHREVYN